MADKDGVSDDVTSVRVTLPEKYMKVPEVAEVFDVTPATVREWLKTGMITGIKINTRWYISNVEVLEFARKKYSSGEPV